MSTLGNTATGGTNVAISSGRVYASGPFLAASPGTVTGLTFIAGPTGLGRTITVGVYTNSTNSLNGASLVTGSQASTAAGAGVAGENDFAISGSIVAGNYYWICVSFNSTGTTGGVYTSVSGANIAYWTGSMGSAVGTLTTQLSDDAHESYVTYTPSATFNSSWAAANRQIGVC